MDHARRHDDATPARRPLARLGAWLFERRPERGPAPLPVPGAEPQPVSQPEPQPVAQPEPQPEAEPRRPGRPRPYPGARPAARAGGAGSASGDAPSPSPDAGRPDGRRRVPRLGSGLRRTARLVVSLAIAVAAVLLLRSYVVSPYYVPSASMEPTLHGCPGCNDDHILVEKLSYLFHDPQRGDVIVFRRPRSWPVNDAVLVKRVIGIPGDRIVLRRGRVYVNGALIDEPYVDPACRHGTTADPTSPDERTKAYPRVGRGQLFVMGDNRCDSEDSRLLGTVPRADVIGRAFLIVWPVHRLHAL